MLGPRRVRSRCSICTSRQAQDPAPPRQQPVIRYIGRHPANNASASAIAPALHLALLQAAQLVPAKNHGSSLLAVLQCGTVAVPRNHRRRPLTSMQQTRPERPSRHTLALLWVHRLDKWPCRMATEKMQARNGSIAPNAMLSRPTTRYYSPST